MDLPPSDDFKKFLLEDTNVGRQKKHKLSTNPSRKHKAQPKEQVQDRSSTGSPTGYRNAPQGPSRMSNNLKNSLKSPLMPPIPEEAQKQAMNYDSSSYQYSQQRSESDGGSFIYQPAVPPSFSRLQSANFYQSSLNSGEKVFPISYTSGGGGSGGASRFYQMIYEQNDEELIIFTRKMFSFFSLQNLVLGIFITYVYNNVPFTEYIGKKFFIFAFAAFIFLTILMMVHVAIDVVRKSPFSYIFYLLFTVSECWVIAFLLATTDDSTVFLFSTTLTSMVFAVSIFLNTQTLTWFRGLLSITLMIILMFFLSILTLNYTDIMTILVCMSGGFFFGIFLLNKAFTLLQNKYSHSLSKDDYVIGSLTIYVDFGFVLLLMLFIMLAMLKSFTS